MGHKDGHIQKIDNKTVDAIRRSVLPPDGVLFGKTLGHLRSYFRVPQAEAMKALVGYGAYRNANTPTPPIKLASANKLIPEGLSAVEAIVTSVMNNAQQGGNNNMNGTQAGNSGGKGSGRGYKQRTYLSHEDAQHIRYLYWNKNWSIVNLATLKGSSPNPIHDILNYIGKWEYLRTIPVPTTDPTKTPAVQVETAPDQPVDAEADTEPVEVGSLGTAMQAAGIEPEAEPEPKAPEPEISDAVLDKALSGLMFEAPQRTTASQPTPQQAPSIIPKNLVVTKNAWVWGRDAKRPELCHCWRYDPNNDRYRTPCGLLVTGPWKHTQMIPDLSKPTCRTCRHFFDALRDNAAVSPPLPYKEAAALASAAKHFEAAQNITPIPSTPTPTPAVNTVAPGEAANYVVGGVEAVRRRRIERGKETAFDIAKKLLLDALANGPRPSREIYALAKEADVSNGTLSFVRQALGVHYEPIPGSNRKQTIWSLPPTASQSEPATTAVSAPGMALPPTTLEAAQEGAARMAEDMVESANLSAAHAIMRTVFSLVGSKLSMFMAQYNYVPADSTRAVDQQKQEALAKCVDDLDAGLSLIADAINDLKAAISTEQESDTSAK